MFELHGWRDLGEELHQLSMQGKWEEMQRLIPEEVLRGFAQTSTYDKLPDFVREHREYASRVGLQMPTRTAEESARFDHTLKEIRAIEAPGVARELA